MALCILGEAANLSRILRAAIGTREDAADNRRLHSSFRDP